MKDSFVLYTDYQEQIELLSMEQRGQLLTAIFAYASTGEVISTDGITAMAFSFIRARMDKDAQKYEEKCEARRKAGESGGRPKKANGFSEKQTKAKKANGFSEKQNNPDSDSDSECDCEGDSDLKKHRRFTPPSAHEVRAYCTENGYAIDADGFVDFYEAKGWYIGKNKMKDWKAAARNWARSQRQESTANGRQELTARPSRNFDNFKASGTDWEDVTRQIMEGQT